jgi:hypothetical protein
MELNDRLAADIWLGHDIGRDADAVAAMSRNRKMTPIDFDPSKDRSEIDQELGLTRESAASCGQMYPD